VLRSEALLRRVASDYNKTKIVQSRSCFRKKAQGCEEEKKGRLYYEKDDFSMGSNTACWPSVGN